jgi:hypothetical protein
MLEYGRVNLMTLCEAATPEKREISSLTGMKESLS